MKRIIEIMNERITILKKAIKTAEKENASFPEGRLRVNKTRRQTRFYQMLDKGDSLGKYLPKKEEDTIRRLGQKDYNKSFLATARSELKQLENFVLKYPHIHSENVYDSLSEERKRLVVPYILSDNLFAKEWQSVSFKANTFMEEKRIYETRRGEKVRSKSEAIIADILFELGIPYRYECPLKLKNGGIRYPDFTLLKLNTRDVIYLEHFGLLDDDHYLHECLRKLDEYRRSGIYIGRNLLFTYETDENPLDIKGIRCMLKEILLEQNTI